MNNESIAGNLGALVGALGTVARLSRAVCRSHRCPCDLCQALSSESEGAIRQLEAWEEYLSGRTTREVLAPIRSSVGHGDDPLQLPLAAGGVVAGGRGDVGRGT